jgi:hypothetical protein
MERICGYQTLTYLLEHLKTWLNNHIHHLYMILVLIGFEQHNIKATIEPNNSLAFGDLLAYLDVRFFFIIINLSFICSRNVTYLRVNLLGSKD